MLQVVTFVCCSIFFFSFFSLAKLIYVRVTVYVLDSIGTMDGNMWCNKVQEKSGEKLYPYKFI